MALTLACHQAHIPYICPFHLDEFESMIPSYHPEQVQNISNLAEREPIAQGNFSSEILESMPRVLRNKDVLSRTSTWIQKLPAKLFGQIF